MGACAEGFGCLPIDRSLRERRYGSIMESLDGCSSTIDHQVVVETMAGGSPFAASGTLKAEGAPWSPNEEHHWGKAGMRTAIGHHTSHLS